jgi:hypothetical protein
MVSCQTNKNQRHVYKSTVVIDTYEKPCNNDKFKDSITLKLVEVKDTRIFELIDTVLFESENCFFIKENQPVRHTLYIYQSGNDDTLKIKIGVEQFNGLYYFERWDVENNNFPNLMPYFFYYEDKCFFVGWHDYLIAKLFKITDTEQKFNIKFGKITNYYTDYPYASDECLYEWFYINGDFYPYIKKKCVPDSTWTDAKINKFINGKKNP